MTRCKTSVTTTLPPPTTDMSLLQRHLNPEAERRIPKCQQTKQFLSLASPHPWQPLDSTEKERFTKTEPRKCRAVCRSFPKPLLPTPPPDPPKLLRTNKLVFRDTAAPRPERSTELFLGPRLPPGHNGSTHSAQAPGIRVRRCLPLRVAATQERHKSDSPDGRSSP